MKKIILLLMAFEISACIPGRQLNVIRKRYISAEKDKSPTYETRTRPIVRGSVPKEKFYEEKVVQISKKKPLSNSGSLVSLDDPKTNLYMEPRPGRIGSYITVLINSSRLDKLKKKKKDLNEDDDGEKLAESLLESLPSLNPGQENPVVMTRMKMRIVDRDENGDAIVAYNRLSQNKGETNSIDIRAKVPRAILEGEDAVTTDDLSQVEWSESNDGAIIDRESNDWEDEYTLRLSGFSEAKSRQAISLDDKRKRLQEVKNNLSNRIKAHSKERSKFSKAREELAEEQKKTADEVSNLSSTITTQKEEIKAQKAKIEELEKILEEERLEREGSNE
ncbi:MAG: hypothetical protein CMP10_13995 [Zetaproteobacteria bacterium]|nr:hypothetical protein [Pseudobdellovibrionaceae bacterium]